MIVTLEPFLSVFEEMAIEHANSRQEEKMSSRITAELKKGERNEHYIVIITDGDSRYMGSTGATPALAKEHALNTAKNLQADAQARLLKAQSDAIAAREVVEAVEKLVVAPQDGAR